MAMDPSSSFTKIMLDEPSESQVQKWQHRYSYVSYNLKHDFHDVDDVHSRRSGPVSTAEFNEYICNALNGWIGMILPNPFNLMNNSKIRLPEKLLLLVRKNS